MKKILVFLLALTMLLISCSGNEEQTSAVSEEQSNTESAAEEVTINVASLKGPTSIGLVELMENCENNTSGINATFTVAGSADEITPKIIQGEFDIASVPVNLASVLYNKTEGKVKVIAANTLGVLYIAAKGEEINSIADLKGKTIYATGKGSTPEYVLKKILAENGLENDVTVEWKSEPSEIVALLKQTESGIAMLPEPYVTTAKANVEGLEVKLDLNDVWAEFSESHIITSVILVRTEFAESHPEAVKKFTEEAAKSVEFVNANVNEAAVLVEKFNIAKAAIAEKAIPNCNIVFITGSQLKTDVSAFLSMLYEFNSASVGGKLPEDDFYYGITD